MFAILVLLLVAVLTVALEPSSIDRMRRGCSRLFRVAGRFSTAWHPAALDLADDGSIRDYLRVPEVAKRYGTSQELWRRLARERKLKHYRINSVILFAVEDVEAWIASSAVEPLTARPTRKKAS